MNRIRLITTQMARLIDKNENENIAKDGSEMKQKQEKNGIKKY